MMIDDGQLLERYRQLSRDIQNNLQKLYSDLDSGRDLSVFHMKEQVSKTLESWDEFSNWILMSTLDDLMVARENNAAGILNVRSKIKRFAHRRKKDLERKAVKLNLSDVAEVDIYTYIPYFEILLELILGNAVKYAPRDTLKNSLKSAIIA